MKCKYCGNKHYYEKTSYCKQDEFDSEIEDEYKEISLEKYKENKYDHYDSNIFCTICGYEKNFSIRYNGDKDWDVEKKKWIPKEEKDKYKIEKNYNTPNKSRLPIARIICTLVNHFDILHAKTSGGLLYVDSGIKNRIWHDLTFEADEHRKDGIFKHINNPIKISDRIIIRELFEENEPEY